MKAKIIIGITILLIILYTLSKISYKKPTYTIVPNTMCINNCNLENFIHAKGTKLYDKNGNQIKLRGVNLGGWLLWEGWIWGKGFTSESKIYNDLVELTSEKDTENFRNSIYKNFITEQDIKKISELNFNMIRVPVNYEVFENVNKIKRIDNLISWCEKYNIYIVLTMHATPGGQSTLFTANPGKTLLWDSKEYQKQTVNVWRQVAERYKDKTIVAGYDLINEPDTKNPDTLLKLYNDIIKNIREVDSNHLIIIEGNKFAKDFSIFNKPYTYNQMYSFHMYTWFRDNREEELSRYIKMANEQNLPMWAGEFGENKLDLIASTLDLYENKNIAGWSFWTWKKAENKYPYLYKIKITDAWKKVIYYIAGSNKKPSKEETLKGMQEFIESIKIQNNVLNNETLKILTKPL
ncbi:hypothetical protein COV24_00590 [candidate division WWE3 bacterium CG10_big_fil_rev_8_21_14_0_10_32_10]|uniref:Glycoside hydrolase family 5 domain-containing protein n=1 Tax=candidate division WWE3 bacterium CG10_big_fil_rev_8_21_14_0_10_32_10 TaxID=1975090 RepID=A0A2H0RCR7_UNCKA|nr:MAG: hypothetical protein COV24_00590 [candidate division WWE3 bacterium CG10_big_fil_rev_8_21_14_0_10_32_10]